MSITRLFNIVALAALIMGACSGDESGPDIDIGIGGEAGVDLSRADLYQSDADGGVIPGSKDILLLRGVVVTPDTVLSPGEVLIEKDNILCVAASCGSDPKASKATVVNTAGIIYPGLIDAHNHTQYNYLPLWKHTKMYSNHGNWQSDSAYKAAVSKPHGQMKSPDGTDGKGACTVPSDCQTGVCTSGKCQNLLCEMIKYGEIRSLIAGTTTIQGTTLRKCADTLIRNADLPYQGFASGDTMQTNVLGVGTIKDPSALLKKFSSGATKSYLIHLSEGIDETARKEFDKLEAMGLLKPQVVVIHGTALKQAELTKLKTAGINMIWSPSSNLDLYGKTNDITTAWKLGIRIALAPDWTPSGDPNVLDELKTASNLNKTKLGNLWTPKQLVKMVTSEAAAIIKFDKEIGKLAKGMRADVLVLSGDPKKPYESLTNASLTQVKLVLVAGKALYGEPALMTKLKPNAYCETVQVCKTPKMLCVKETSTSSTQMLDQSYGDIVSRLNKGYTPGIYTLSTCK